MSKEVKQLIKKLVQLGCDVREGRNNHFIVELDGRWVSSLPHSPKGTRWLLNTKAELRRNGVAI